MAGTKQLDKEFDQLVEADRKSLERGSISSRGKATKDSMVMELPTQANTVNQDKARLTRIETIYYQSGQEEPIVEENRYTEYLAEAEQPYKRRTSVGDSWAKVDLGWLTSETCGVIIISNLESRFTKTIPTEKEKQESDTKILEIGFGSPIACLLIKPGEQYPLRPTTELYIRCQSGAGKYSVTAFPK